KAVWMGWQRHRCWLAVVIFFARTTPRGDRGRPSRAERPAALSPAVTGTPSSLKP
ncbi:major facilitator transporter, partial [Pseudomonas syringae pv. japonica str. M301072]